MKGGFLSNLEIGNKLIRGSWMHSHETHKLSNLYKAINYLNNIKFKINDKVLKFFF